MIDFVLGAFLAGLLVRGWLRGFVREALDLAGLVVGVIVAFRLSAPLGDLLTDRFGIASEWARLGAGIVLFVAVGTAMAVLAHYMGRVMSLPGLNLANRVGGAAVAAAWGVLLVLVGVSVIRAFDPPDTIATALDQSSVVTAIAAPGAVPQEAFEEVAGDEVLATLIALRESVGQRRVVLEDGETLPIPAAEPEELSDRPDDAADIYARINVARAGEGADPLAWSDGLAEVARAHATDMYVNGYVSHVSPATGNAADRVSAAGIRVLSVGENLALATSSRAVHQGLMESPGHRANIVRPEFDVVGVAAVRGPSGLMVVQVFGDR